MTIGNWLSQTQQQFAAHQIATARLDALVLLEDALGLNRAIVLAHPEQEISTETQNVLSLQVDRRITHEPLAYIRGVSEFYGREFSVSPAVLIPRPESEIMIELLAYYVSLQPTKPEPSLTALHGLMRTNSLRLADVGAGSGALGITAALELPSIQVDLLEVDDAAIEIAKTNVIKLTSGISVLKTNLLDGSDSEYDVLLCNLPYVPDEYSINEAARHEPPLALFAGTDGLDLYLELFEQIKQLIHRPLLILTEALPDQHAALRSIAQTAGYFENSRKDFIQAFMLAD